MKYVLIVVVFCLCVFVGILFSNKYTRRKRFFESLIALADKLALDIKFSRQRLKVLLENFDASNKKNLLGIDENFIEFLDKKCELSNETLFKKADILKAEEKDFILLFFKTLGRSDVENQTKEIQSFIARFNEFKTKCDTEQKKYGALSWKLGVVAGLFWAVIMF
mgnify:CR=1 FL=1